MVLFLFGPLLLCPALIRKNKIAIFVFAFKNRKGRPETISTFGAGRPIISVKEPGFHTVTLNAIPLTASTVTSSTILLLPLSLVRPSSASPFVRAGKQVDPSAHFFYFAAKINSQGPWFDTISFSSSMMS